MSGRTRWVRPLLVFDPDYSADIGAHVFQIEKYRLIYERLTQEGDTRPEDWVTPAAATTEELLRVHTPEYLDDFLNCRWTPRTATSEFPLSPEIAQAHVLTAGGSIVACRKALERGISANIGGGLHHAFADQAAGFCYINDIAVGIRAAQAEGLIERAAVIDCDLHQGNGTARIFEGDDSVFTFSMHQENLYPAKEKSDLDIGLPDGTGDDLYLSKLMKALPEVLDRAEPELVVYQAGADPYAEDQLGNLTLSLEGLRDRDRLVLGACHERGIPTVITLGGGYARKPADTVTIHATTCRVAMALAAEVPG
jgi:acetoin utilization deacetylase AcuC-like enzyme